ncbi:protein SLOW GREEN 1, chloroplastic [Typha latifolia]|uniref:protein SLOW GREEN 1, chloroplastic n=1 Tax=Typha latifolia TaxID=4733 RepID=UPI003C2C514F
MASFPSASLSIRGFHPKPFNLSKLGFRNNSYAALFPPLLHKPPSFFLKSPTRNQFQPNLPKIYCSRDRGNPSLLRSCVKELAVLLVGSLFFLGRFNCRPVLAVDNAQRSNFSAPLEEKMDTQVDKDGKDAVDEEEMEEEVIGDEQKGKDDEVEMYEKILEKNPTDVEALKVVLFGKMRKGKTREAVGYVERLIALEPDEVEWRLLHALTYELMGKLSKAKKLFKEILKERPLLLRALHGLALTMHKSGEGPAVFEMLNKALRLAHHENRVTEERNIKTLIAQMHVVKGDLDGALKRFQDLANENPRDFRPYLCQGIIYSLLDKKKEADEQFEIYRGLVPDEFPQRGFIDDVIFSAKTESQEQLEKEFESEFSYKR